MKNEEILNRMQTKLHFMEDMIKRKMKYAGHVNERIERFITTTDIRGSSREKTKSWVSKKKMDGRYY